MSVQSEIDRIKKNVDDTLKAISDTGVQVGTGSDALPAAARALANEKQDKLTGTQGQVVGFDESGKAVAQDMPERGSLLTFGAHSIEPSNFLAIIAYDGYSFRASIPLPGVTADYVPSVTFGIADAISGNLAPVADSYAGGVYIYAKEQPTTTVSVLSVVCVKGA